ALCLGLLPHQRAYGIDIFEAQSFNIDWSGKGSQHIVEDNLRRFGISQPSVILDARSSNLVMADDILSSVGRVRFFSIDGGHWRSIVASDLSLAEAVLADQGVIALDDFLRSEWPDVSLGFFHWYENGPKSIRPFAVGHNKLYLCHS